MHPTTVVNGIEVDELWASPLSSLWSIGIKTHACCQEVIDNTAFLEVAGVDSAIKADAWFREHGIVPIWRAWESDGRQPAIRVEIDPATYRQPAGNVFDSFICIVETCELDNFTKAMRTATQRG